MTDEQRITPERIEYIGCLLEEGKAGTMSPREDLRLIIREWRKERARAEAAEHLAEATVGNRDAWQHMSDCEHAENKRLLDEVDAITAERDTWKARAEAASAALNEVKA